TTATGVAVADATATTAKAANTRADDRRNRSGRRARDAGDGGRDTRASYAPGVRPPPGRWLATGGSLAAMLPLVLRAASSRPRPRRRRRRLRAIVLVVAIAAVAVGCADNADNLKASATPADFFGIVNEFARL